MTSYSCDDIQVLKGLEGIRRRPGMYVGNTSDGSGLHVLLWELVDNVIAEHRRGLATELRVELAGDWVTVRDDGAGLPVDLVPRDGVSVLEKMFTQLHCGVPWSSVYPWMHRWYVGLPSVSALSTRVEVETTRDGVRWAQAFERGERVTPLRRLGPTSIEGTTIRFRPDPEIFGTSTLDPDVVHARLIELARLVPQLRIWFQERRLPVRGGVEAWASELASRQGPVVGRHVLVQMTHGAYVELSCAWNQTGACDVRSYANLHATSGGTHVDGLWRGFASHARAHHAAARTLAHVREAIGVGFTAILAVGLPCPRFGSQTREVLTSAEAAAAVETAIVASLANDEGYPSPARRFVDQRLGIKAER